MRLPQGVHVVAVDDEAHLPLPDTTSTWWWRFVPTRSAINRHSPGELDFGVCFPSRLIEEA